MDEELRTPNTVQYIARMIAELCRSDREQLLTEVLPQLIELPVQRPLAQEVQAEEHDRLLCGDYFTNDRTGVRFVCRAVTRHDYGELVPMLRAEIEPAPYGEQRNEEKRT